MGKRLVVIGATVVLAPCLAMILVALSRWCARSAREFGSRTPAAAALQTDAEQPGPAAAELTPEEVLAALERAGFHVESLRTDGGDLPSCLKGALRQYSFGTSIGGVSYHITLTSYADSESASRVAEAVCEINRQTQGNFAYGISRGRVVVTVWPVDQEMVDKLERLLRGAG